MQGLLEPHELLLLSVQVVHGDTLDIPHKREEAGHQHLLLVEGQLQINRVRAEEEAVIVGVKHTGRAAVVHLLALFDFENKR